MTVETTGVADDIAGFLKDRFPMLSGTSITGDTALLTSGAIDSLGILDLVTFLSERFGVELSDEDFDPANFETFGQLVSFVERSRA
ncbi:MAG: acyl carrier protein [Phreatobacter sp.]|nr:acyl carrier protein [Phreatobacter sp.]